MRLSATRFRRLVLLTCGLALLCLYVGAAHAESLREFSGVISAAGADQIAVANRQGDSLSFRRADGTKVSGAKSSWGSLAEGDGVIVSWKLGERPPIAHRVRVK